MSSQSNLPMSVSPRVLVLLATYNGADYLKAQLATIASQQSVDVQVLASDDCSSDGSLEQLRGAATYLAIQTLPNWPGAGSAAGNFYRLIRECKPEDFDFVAFADQDDMWCPDKLKRAVDCLRATDASGYSAAVRAFWPNGQSRVLRQSSRESPGDFLFEGGGQGCTFVLTRAAFLRVQAIVRREVELTKAAHFHDWLTYAICRASGATWAFDAEPVLDYRQHAANMHGARSSIAATRKRIGLIRSGWYASEIEAMYRVVCAAAPGHPEARAFDVARSARRRGLGSLSWLKYIATRSRRRVSDRGILIAAVLMGWI